MFYVKWLKILPILFNIEINVTFSFIILKEQFLKEILSMGYFGYFFYGV